MFTSRAEYRILLRQDNADERLSEIGRTIGLVDDFRWKTYQNKKKQIEKLSSALKDISLSPEQGNPYLTSVGEAPIESSKRASDLLVRPNVTLSGLIDAGLFHVEQAAGNGAEPRQVSLDRASEIALTFPWAGREKEAEVVEDEQEILDAVEIEIKYAGYIDREKRIAEKILRLEDLEIPEGFDFFKITALSMECRIKLDRYRPRTISQASRISGVSPADISVLLVYFGR
jgi:tRNA uridine 5-carboxymethylaminomethyl modification enzyme